MSVEFERQDRIATITLNRPDKMNAMTTEMYADISQRLKEIDEDPDIWVGIITGTGDRAFSAGADLAMEGRAGGLLGLDSGQKIQKITLTRHEGAMAIKREICYTESPAYRPKTSDVQGVDYDMNGRLIVWRHTCERSLIEPDFQGHQAELVCLMVSPDGEITEEYGAKPTFDIYQPADMQRYFLSWNPILATGRGFSKHLSKIVEVSGLQRCVLSIVSETEELACFGLEIAISLKVNQRADGQTCGRGAAVVDSQCSKFRAF